jgi:hypothetical protein
MSGVTTDAILALEKVRAGRRKIENTDRNRIVFTLGSV